MRAAAVRTFLIADIRGWTAFTAERGDEAASNLAKKFAEVATEGVEAWGGSVVELRGDEVLAVFDSARNGLRAAAELQSAFAAETRLEPDLPLTVGIGVDAGEAVPVGDGFRGAALNVAARLCATAQAGETIATQTVTHLAGAIPSIEYEELEPAHLKGLKKGLTPVRIAATTDGESTATGYAVGVAPSVARRQLPAELEPIVPLAGRQAEFRWLRWHWRRAGHGNGRSVVMSGQPGIGKTRLASELAALAYAGGASVFYLPSSAGPEDTGEVLGALADNAQILVIVDDLDAAGHDLVDRAGELGVAFTQRRALLLVTHREEAAAPLLSLVEHLAPNLQRRRLGPLEPGAVRAIAALYAGRSADRIPSPRSWTTAAACPRRCIAGAVRGPAGQPPNDSRHLPGGHRTAGGNCARRKTS